MQVFFENILINHQWTENVSIQLSSSGEIEKISHRQTPSKESHVVKGLFIPGFPNGHSHAFQYGMVGSAEHLPKGQGTDNFWSWRDSMYSLALSLTPEKMTEIAFNLYREMLMQGITSVTEFHYLHHREDGTPYAPLSHMAKAVIEGASKAGIHLTLVPVYYRLGDFHQEASPEQRRFLFKNISQYQELLAQLNSLSGPDLTIGAGVHSLRGADQEEVKEILTPGKMDVEGPLHIHIAEQQLEVNNCLKLWGKRPVDWLTDNIELTHRHHLVHATHLTPEETTKLATSDATVVICPSTEGSLGDGFFPLLPFLHQGGSFSIGSDSHIGLSFPEELRWLDYQNRLHQQQRNVICNNPGDDSGAILFKHAIDGGRRSLGLSANPFAIGATLDGIELDDSHPTLAQQAKERWLSTFIYSGGVRTIKGVMRRGQWVVRDSVHKHGGF